MAYTEKNLPSVLRTIVDRWDKQGNLFSISPENLFSYKGQKLKYNGNHCIPSKTGTWSVTSQTFSGEGFPELSQNQIEDIATHFIQLYSPNSWGVILDYRCNYSCPMCPFQGEGYTGDYWADRQSQKRAVPKDEAFAIIDKLVDNNVKKVVLTSPGELFLYPHWEEVSSYATLKGLIVSTITNGSMINEELCQRMKNAGIKEVSVSLDAVSEEVYAKVRSSNPKHYQSAMNTPLLLKKYDFKVNVHFVQQKANLHEKDGFIHQWMNTEIDSISIGYQTEYHDGYSVDKIGFAKEEFIHGLCSWYGNFVILADGTVTACCEMQTLFKDKDSFGLPKLNFLQESYEEIVKTMNRLMSDSNSPLKTICQKCSMYTLPSNNFKQENQWKIIYTRGGENWNRETSLEYDIDLCEKVNRLFKQWKENSKKVLIYGAGVHTQDLFNFTNLSDTEIVGISDSNSKRYGERIFGFKVISPEQISSVKPDIILISSKAFQDNIYHQLKHFELEGIELVRIYD